MRLWPLDRAPRRPTAGDRRQPILPFDERDAEQLRRARDERRQRQEPE